MLNNLEEVISDILERHRIMAEQSTVDRKTAMNALYYASQVISQFQWSMNMFKDLEDLVVSLDKFKDEYNDKSGEYSSGKGEIGSLTREIASLHADLISKLPKIKYYI